MRYCSGACCIYGKFCAGSELLHVGSVASRIAKTMIGSPMQNAALSPEELEVPAKPRLSAIVITLNEAEQIEACLDSLSFADEIIVVDSGSTDATCALAAKMGAKVVHHPWMGFGRQKQYGVDQARHDWVLCVDADERISEALRADIIKTLDAPAFRVYRMARCNRFMGRWLRHGEGYPDWSVRLFRRDAACWSDDTVHEKVCTTQDVGTLRGDLLHDSAESLNVYLEKQNKYTTLQASHLVSAGKTVHAGHLVLSPLVRFIKFYFVRLGLLDGVPGLVHISIGCFNSFMKYAKTIAATRRG